MRFRAREKRLLALVQSGRNSGFPAEPGGGAVTPPLYRRHLRFRLFQRLLLETKQHTFQGYTCLIPELGW
jgi:hypothetical protein